MRSVFATDLVDTLSEHIVDINISSNSHTGYNSVSLNARKKFHHSAISTRASIPPSLAFPLFSASPVIPFSLLSFRLSSFGALFSVLICALSSSLKILGRSSMGGPHGATISVTTCLIRPPFCQPVAIRTTSPCRRDELGSETRWDW